MNMDIQNWIEKKEKEFDEWFPSQEYTYDDDMRSDWMFNDEVDPREVKSWFAKETTALLAEIEKSIEGFIESTAAEKCDENHENCTIAGSKMMAYQRVLKLLRPSEPKGEYCNGEPCTCQLPK